MQIKYWSSAKKQRTKASYIMPISKLETPNSEWHTSWCAGKQIGFVHQQGLDPLGSHDSDWEYQGRYLELEKQLLAGTCPDGRCFSSAQTAALQGGRLPKRGGARSAAGRGSDYEAYAGAGGQRHGDNPMLEEALGDGERELGGEIKGPHRRGKGRPGGVDHPTSQSGDPSLRAVTVRGFSHLEGERRRATGSAGQRLRPTSRKSGWGKKQRQGKV
jgi:hypothetical protein